MNRFVSEKRRRPSCRLLFSLLLTVSVPVLLWLGADLLETSVRSGGEVQLRQAVDRAVMQCYAAEGAYPPDIFYLEEHYGLLYERKHYLVDYQSNGSNLLPDVTVIRLEPDEE